MTIYQYTRMSENAQLNTLEEVGVLVGERKVSHCDIKLYQLSNFYVELYHHSHFNVVVNINSFTNTDMLEPYFENFNIDELVCAN
jgi:hypothetical protein